MADSHQNEARSAGLLDASSARTSNPASRAYSNEDDYGEKPDDPRESFEASADDVEKATGTPVSKTSTRRSLKDKLSVKSKISVNNVASIPNGGARAWWQVAGSFFLLILFFLTTTIMIKLRCRALEVDRNNRYRNLGSAFHGHDSCLGDLRNAGMKLARTYQVYGMRV